MPHRPLASSPEPPPAPFRHVSWHFPLRCSSAEVLGLIKLIVFNLLGTNQPESFYSSALGLCKLCRMASPFGWRPRWNGTLCVMLSEFHYGARSAGFSECNVWRQNLLRACCIHPALSTMESDDALNHPIVAWAIMSLWPVASFLHRDESG